jgi:hypothetical protein
MRTGQRCIFHDRHRRIGIAQNLFRKGAGREQIVGVDSRRGGGLAVGGGACIFVLERNEQDHRADNDGGGKKGEHRGPLHKGHPLASRAFH